MDKLFLIKLWFEKEISAESEEKAIEIFFGKFNETELVDLDHYQLDEIGEYHEYKDEMINSNILKIECGICGKELNEGDLKFF